MKSKDKKAKTENKDMKLKEISRRLLEERRFLY